MVVADAAYRFLDLAFYTIENNSFRLANAPTFTSANSRGNWNIFSSTTLGFKTPVPRRYHIHLMYTLWSCFKTDKTAKENCDLWLGQVNASLLPAISAARSVTLPGATECCNLPNIFQALVIYMLSDDLDVIDPTAAGNPTKMLGYQGTNGRLNGKNIWSSTNYGVSGHWHVRIVGTNWSGDNQCSSCATYRPTLNVVPVLEID